MAHEYIRILDGGSASAYVAVDTVSGSPTLAYQVNKIDLGGDGLSSPLVRGQLTLANSIPVALASDTVLPLPSTAATEPKQDDMVDLLTTIDADTSNLGTIATTLSSILADTASMDTSLSLLDNTVTSNRLQVDINSGTVTASGTLVATSKVSGAATTTAVADTASSTTLLASNVNRAGFAITNTSSAVLYVKFGSTASSTSFVKLVEATTGYFGDAGIGVYTGIITGIWATDPGTGSAIITEWVV